MNHKNIQEILELKEKLLKKNIHVVFVNSRWMAKGEINNLVRRKDVKKLDRFLKQHGFKRYQFYSYWKKYYVKYSNKELIIWDAHIDDYEGASKKVLKNQKGNLTSTRQVYLHIYNSTYKNDLSKHKDYIEALSEKADHDLLQKYLKESFKNPNTIYFYFKRKQYEKIKPILRYKHQIHKPKYVARNTTFKFLRIINKLFKPGKYFVIMGTDGSGKTTTLNEVRYILKKHLKVKTSRGSRFKFKCLPLNFLVNKIATKAKKTGKASSEGDVINYKSNLLRYTIPFVYYIEYFLRYFFITYPQRIRNNVVMEDRYFLDLLTSNNANKKLARFLYTILPKPSNIVYLHNNIKTITKRRPEHPKEDIIRQQKIFNEYSKLFNKKVKTDNLDNSVDEICHYLTQKL